jgi:hypothetical protein
MSYDEILIPLGKLHGGENFFKLLLQGLHEKLAV